MLLVLALALRFVGLDFQLPTRAPVDERVFVGQTRLFRADVAEPEREAIAGYYPHLVSRVAAWTLPAEVRAAEPDSRSDADALEDELCAAGELHLHVRRVIALLSLLVVPATYSLARRFLARRDALVAAALAATSVVFTWYAQEGRPHAVVAAFSACALVAFTRVAERGRWRDHAFAAACVALATAGGQFGLLLAPAWGLAHFARPRGARVRELPRFAACALASALAAAFAYPFLGVAPGGEERPGHHLFGEYAVGDFNAGLAGFSLFARKAFAFEPVLSALIVVCACAALARLVAARRRARPSEVLATPVRRAGAIVGVHALVAFGVCGYLGAGLPRYQLALLPAACVVAASGLARLRGSRGSASTSDAFAATIPSPRDPSSRTPLARVRARAAFAVTALVLVAETATTARISYVRAADDTAELAARAVARAVADPDARIGLPPALDLPLPRTPEALAAESLSGANPVHPWIERQLAAPRAWRRAYDLRPFRVQELTDEAGRVHDPGDWIDRWGLDWVVVEVFATRLVKRLRADLAERGELVARFAPGAGDVPFLVIDQDAPQFEDGPLWLRVWRVERLGTVIEVWRVEG